MPNVNRMTVASTATASSRGIPCGLSDTRNATPHTASSSPSAPPASERITHSVSSWRTSRPRPAPSAARTAISDSRAAARASSRLATLAQAMSSTKPTAPSRTSTERRMSPTIASCSGYVVMPTPSLASGYWRARLRAERLDFRRRLLRRHAGLQPRDDVEIPGAALLRDEALVVLDRQPGLAPRGIREPGRHHADDLLRRRRRA